MDRQKPIAMDIYSRIVVPLDGSELAQGILPHVSEIARGRGSQVHLLTVVPIARRIPPVLADLLPTSAGTLKEMLQAKRRLSNYLQGLAQELTPASEVHVSVRFGNPVEEILAFTEEIEADLIALSAHGRSGISRWVFGSVTDRVLHDVPCPLLLIPNLPAYPQPTYQRILIPLDGSDLAEQVLPYVSALVRPNHTRIFLLSVLADGLSDRAITMLTSSPPGLHLSTTALSKAQVQMRAYLRSVAAALRQHGATVQVDIRHGTPAEEILNHAQEVEADLVSLTTHGLSGAMRWVYGNVASKVLHGMQSPVLLVRPRIAP